MSEDTVVALSTAITAHGNEVQSLSLRRPTGKDVREIGLPYKMMVDESVTVQTEVAAKYISRLAAIPMSSVDAIDPADFNTLAWAVAGFFMAPATTPKV